MRAPGLVDRVGPADVVRKLLGLKSNDRPQLLDPVARAVTEMRALRFWEYWDEGIVLFQKRVTVAAVAAEFSTLAIASAPKDQGHVFVSGVRANGGAVLHIMSRATADSTYALIPGGQPRDTRGGDINTTLDVPDFLSGSDATYPGTIVYDLSAGEKWHIGDGHGELLAEGTEMVLAVSGLAVLTAITVQITGAVILTKF